MEWVGAHTTPSGTPGDYGLLRIAGITGSAINEWLVTPGEAEEFFDEPTLVRQRIDTIVALLDPPNTPSPGALYAAGWMGIIIMPGDGAVPDPSIRAADASKDWAWWRSYNFGASTAGATSYVTGNAPIDTIDVRSKRKIPSGYGIAFYLERSGINNEDVQFGFQWRGLFANK